MEKIATDGAFERLRKCGFTYVDKTGILWPLVNGSIGSQFFLARPWRFGKSLLVSTLRSLFEGKHELFQGLAIEPKWDWSQTWPVIECEMEGQELFADETGAKFATLMKTAFAKIPHEWLDKSEKEIKRYFLAYMIFARAEVVSEEQHSLGRPDSVVKTEKAVYVVEFKYDKSAEAALAQCREKRYADAYAADPRRVVYVGVNYDPAARTIGEVKTEAVR